MCGSISDKTYIWFNVQLTTKKARIKMVALWDNRRQQDKEYVLFANFLLKRCIRMWWRLSSPFVIVITSPALVGQSRASSDTGRCELPLHCKGCLGQWELVKDEERGVEKKEEGKWIYYSLFKTISCESSPVMGRWTGWFVRKALARPMIKAWELYLKKKKK